MFVKILNFGADSPNPEELAVRDAVLTVGWVGGGVEEITVGVSWLGIQICLNLLIGDPLLWCPGKVLFPWNFPL